jgi:phenylalanyl-tRNA synthetase beta chain
MKVTYNWLKDFVDIDIPAERLAQRLTMAGLEVVSLEQKKGDWVFEIEITSNRPDWLSVVGIAREVAAITAGTLRRDARFCLPSAKAGLPDVRKDRDRGLGIKDQRLKIQIENKKDCPLYIARIIKNVKIKPSPRWLKERLELVGCRSINNVVDITNYVLFETGQPLHAFDLDKVISTQPSVPNHQPQIIIRRARQGEKMVTIDGLERILDKEILVIASGEPIALAGVMGGQDTEVTEGTRDILLEAAVFNPQVIRKARQKLGLQSESSYRFERAVNVYNTDLACRRATKLIEEITQGKLVSTISAQSLAIRTKPKKISLDLNLVEQILGVCIPVAKVKNILQSLQFDITCNLQSATCSVTVPRFRQDISKQIDIIEEIARLFGYHKISPCLPAINPQLINLSTYQLIRLIKDILISQGLDEVITYSLLGKEVLEGLNLSSPEAVNLANPLSRDRQILRPTLIPGLITVVLHNLRQGARQVRIFEIGKIFSTEKESISLGLALYSEEELSILHLKGIIEVLLGRLGLQELEFTVLQQTRECFKPEQSICLNYRQKSLGLAGALLPSVLQQLDIRKGSLFIASLSLQEVLPLVTVEKKFVSLPLYPAVCRDISFILKDNIPAASVIKVIKNKPIPQLVDVQIVDYYKGKQIPEGFKGLTVSCLYRSKERTLTSEEVQVSHRLISALLKQEFGAQIR